MYPVAFHESIVSYCVCFVFLFVTIGSFASSLCVCTLFLDLLKVKATWSLYCTSPFVIPPHMGLKILNPELAHSERTSALCPGDWDSSPTKDNIQDLSL